MKKHLKTFRGFYIFVLGVIFNISESLYYGQGSPLGFYLTPHSKGEMICDGISSILFVLGMFLVLLEGRGTVIRNIETFNHYTTKED